MIFDMEKRYEKIDKAMSRSVKVFGKNILTDKTRLLNILSDYQVFMEYPEYRAIIVSLLNEGFTKKVLSAPFWSKEKYVRDVIEKTRANHKTEDELYLGIMISIARSLGCSFTFDSFSPLHIHKVTSSESKGQKNKAFFPKQQVAQPTSKGAALAHCLDMVMSFVAISGLCWAIYALTQGKFLSSFFCFAFCIVGSFLYYRLIFKKSQGVTEKISFLRIFMLNTPVCFFYIVVISILLATCIYIWSDSPKGDSKYYQDVNDFLTIGKDQHITYKYKEFSYNEYNEEPLCVFEYPAFLEKELYSCLSFKDKVRISIDEMYAYKDLKEHIESSEFEITSMSTDSLTLHGKDNNGYLYARQYKKYYGNRYYLTIMYHVSLGEDFAQVVDHVINSWRFVN